MKAAARKSSSRLVFEADATLFLYHFAFGFKILFRNIQATHAVGFEPQHPFQIIAGEGFEKIGGVVGGFSVVESAHGFDDAGKFFSRNVRRTLKHQVLEEVRETGAAGQFVFGTYVIPDLEIDYRHGMIFEENYLQPVGEGADRVIHFGGHDIRRFLLGSGGSVGQCSDDGQAQDGHAASETMGHSHQLP